MTSEKKEIYLTNNKDWTHHFPLRKLGNVKECHCIFRIFKHGKIIYEATDENGKVTRDIEHNYFLIRHEVKGWEIDNYDYQLIIKDKNNKEIYNEEGILHVGKIVFKEDHMKTGDHSMEINRKIRDEIIRLNETLKKLPCEILDDLVKCLVGDRLISVDYSDLKEILKYGNEIEYKIENFNYELADIINKNFKSAILIFRMNENFSLDEISKFNEMIHIDRFTYGVLTTKEESKVIVIGFN